MSLILLVLLILLIFGSLPVYPYSTNWGYYPSSTLTIILVVIVFLLFTGKL